MFRDGDDNKCPELLSLLKKPVTEELEATRDSIYGVVRLPSFSKISGDEKDNNAFVHSIRNLEKHMEIEVAGKGFAFCQDIC